jgi:hypothetical protein
MTEEYDVFMAFEDLEKIVESEKRASPSSSISECLISGEQSL